MCQAPEKYVYPDIYLYGFFYDPVSADYKFIVGGCLSDEEVRTDGMSSLIHAYTLESDSWKSFLTPHYFLITQKSGVLFKGDLHWLSLSTGYKIVTLDIMNEKFNEIEPPSKHVILVGVVEERLCVLAEDDSGAFEIWKMQVYGDPNSWAKRCTVTHEVITKRISFQMSSLRFMWSFETGVVLFMDQNDLVLYDLEHGSVLEQSVVNYLSSAENVSESFVSLNSGTYVGGRTTNTQTLNNRISALEERNAELEADNSQLVADNAELKRKLHESQVAYQNLEQRVMLQKEAEGVKKDQEEEEIDMAKKKGQKRKVNHQHNTRKASKAAGERTHFEDGSFTVQQGAEKG